MHTPHPSMRITRRATLLGLGGAIALGRAALAVAPAPGDQRFVVILLRGAMDGMSAVAPYGDPNFAAIRGPLALDTTQLQDLGGFYGLHPSFPNLHAMFKASEAGFVHASAGGYRTRSHFEAQDYMEAGIDQRLDNGWLNRAVSAMPARGEQPIALSIGLSPPLILRGPAQVQAWAPDKFGMPDPDLLARIAALTARDPAIGPAFASILSQRNQGEGMPDMANTQGKDNDFAYLASAAGKLLAEPNGPRVAALEIGGWDTHQGQVKRLEKNFSLLDDGFGVLKTALGPAWRNTVIIAITEFGRTAHINGTSGTDHGTGSVTFLAGGAVVGGKVGGTWPGLSGSQLFENRDLSPTTDVRSIAKGVLMEHLGIASAHFAQIFPSSANASPMRGLVRV